MWECMYVHRNTYACMRMHPHITQHIHTLHNTHTLHNAHNTPHTHTHTHTHTHMHCTGYKRMAQENLPWNVLLFYIVNCLAVYFLWLFLIMPQWLCDDGHIVDASIINTGF